MGEKQKERKKCKRDEFGRVEWGLREDRVLISVRLGFRDRVLGIGFKPYPIVIGGHDDLFMRKIGGVISLG